MKLYTYKPKMQNTCVRFELKLWITNNISLYGKLTKFPVTFQSLLAVDVGTLINFLPTLLNQLFKLLPSTNSEDVALNAVR